MFRFVSKRKIVFAPIIVAACICAGFFIHLAQERHIRAESKAIINARVVDQRNYWKQRVSSIGTKPAYKEFADAIVDLSPQEQHTEAHIFGAALFDAAGIGGVSACDVQFSYGCFHAFMGSAIVSLGLGVVNQLNQGCRDSLGPDALACQHGIGHGLIAYFGYDEPALKKALDTCASLPYSDPIGGCPGGAFMEYNLKTIAEADQPGSGIRAEDEGDPLAPCDSLPDQFRASCYFWQVQWWDQIGKQKRQAIDATFAQIGTYCALLPQDLSRSCFEGTGNIVAADANFDGATAKSLCEITTQNPTDQLYCKSYAANSLFVGGAGAKGDASVVCSGLSDGASTYCLAYAKNEANILNSRDTPSL